MSGMSDWDIAIRPDLCNVPTPGSEAAPVQRKSWFSDAMDWVQGGLDVASVALDATGVGGAVSWIPDVLNAGISAGRGDWTGAGLSMAAAVPFAGAAANATRLGRTVVKHGDEAVDLGQAATKTATSRRVKLRKNTRQQIEANQPRNAAGEMIDPNTGQVLQPGEIDVGHKAGQEWRKRKQMHEDAGSTRREVLDAENDADLYHLEDRSSNRSHRYEEK